MDKKIYSFLFSTRLMAVLFIVFPVAMACGTFIESYYNTETARILIYNAWWFEAIMVFFVINFCGNIKKYQLYKREKWTTLLLHLSFILILVGAFVTRYISFEGLMPIREGATENVFYSDKTYITTFVDGDYKGEMKRKTFEHNQYFSQATTNNFAIKNEFNGIPFEIEYVNFIMNASETITPSSDGDFYLKMVESGDGSRHEHYLKEGQVQNIHNVLFAFNKFTDGAINITKNEDVYTLQTPFEGSFMRMADKMQGSVVKDSLQPLMMRSLYNIGGSQFVFPDAAIKGKITYKSNNDYKDKQTDDALELKIKSQGLEDSFTLVGSKGKQGIPHAIKLGDLEFTLFFGSKIYDLPFSIKVDDFIADKYPGTEKSYSSFKSKLEVIDTENKKTFKDSVFMNNILDYGGYRFFQASFDADEKGTVLSVSHDAVGTWISYVGYFLLYFAMLVLLFDKNTRFGDLKRKLDKVKAKKSSLMVLLFLTSLTGFSQEHNHLEDNIAKSKEIIEKYKVSEEHASKFGQTVIQDRGGRMKPVNTFSSELLRKVSKSDTYNDMNSDQVFISMTQFPRYWYNIPVISLKRDNDSIRKIIGIEKDAKYASLANFFDAKGNYKLAFYLKGAFKAIVPNQFQKDFIDADKKVNLLYDALSGQIMRVFPIPNNPENKWVSYLELNEPTGTALDSIKNLMPFYLDAVSKSTESKDYTLPNDLLNGLQKYQQKYGAKIMPSTSKINAEIKYNKFDIFKRLFYLYMLAGVLMLIFTIIQLFTKSVFVKNTVKFFHVLIGLFFILHTLGLIARWYISGHAPWSDAYESMIYVAWATMFFGLAFGRKSQLTVASTAFVASMILMIAHWSYMDPAIANLVPVLNSYWLMIHVAVIVASYGPFTLAMILGLVALLLLTFTNNSNKEKMKLAIAEITYINEMALTVGLVMLTIGNFLGGQWANESWGRYWGWDPKETWALVSVLIYAFVLHMRLIPALSSFYTFNLATLVAIWSIIMTYFGVNYYLSGLHSYAAGDPMPIPSFVYYLIVITFITAILARNKYKRYY